MSARIRSLLNSTTPIDELSRDDVSVGDVVTVQALDGAATYAWALVYVPEGSSATFSGSLTAVSPGSFTADVEGPYLVRLTVDAGRSTETTQYVRLRSLTSRLGLSLVAAGERRDEGGTIPVDADPTGWANEQNANLLLLERAASGIAVMVAGETLLAGDVVGLDQTAGGARVIASSATASVVLGRNFAAGVAVAAADSGDPVEVILRPGTVAAVNFDSAPSASDQGAPVYVHTVPGEVTLTAPVASGTEVVRVGLLLSANDSTVLFFPQYVSSNP